MSKTVQVPDRYTERVRDVAHAQVDVPAITLKRSQHIQFLKKAYVALGEPNAIRCFVDGNKIAFVPSDEDHPNSYSVWGASQAPRMTGGWVKYELKMGEPTRGCYELERDGDLWIVDFESEPIKTFEDDE
jgi:hypothetical protein